MKQLVARERALALPERRVYALCGVFRLQLRLTVLGSNLEDGYGALAEHRLAQGKEHGVLGYAVAAPF